MLVNKVSLALSFPSWCIGKFHSITENLDKDTRSLGFIVFLLDPTKPFPRMKKLFSILMSYEKERGGKDYDRRGQSLSLKLLLSSKGQSFVVVYTRHSDRLNEHTRRWYGSGNTSSGISSYQNILPKRVKIAFGSSLMSTSQSGLSSWWS